MASATPLKAAIAERPAAHVLTWALVSVTLVTFLGVSRLDTPASLSSVSLVAWVVLVALADLSAVRLRASAQFSVSLPILLAAAMATNPAQAGLIALIGYVDLREFRGETGLRRAIFNRAEVTLSVMVASVAFHATGGELDSWPDVIASAAACLMADFLVNSACVAGINSILFRRPFLIALRELLPERDVSEFVGAYVCLGLTGLVIAGAFSMGGVWGLAVASAPLFFASKMLDRGQRLAETTADLRRKEEGLAAATKRMESERRDERAVLAGSLHDDVLPPLFKVQLMADVVKRDLECGALFDLETDLPMMLEAAEATSDAIRGLVGDLRRSSLGPGGLVPTLRLRARDIETRSQARVHLRVDRVPSDAVVELVAYQVAREAIENAATHGEASEIVVTLAQERGGYGLTVRDDGRGFDPGAGSPDGHFGLTLMGERVAAIGGSLHVESQPGSGSLVTAWLPAAVT